MNIQVVPTESNAAFINIKSMNYSLYKFRRVSTCLTIETFFY